MSLTRPAVGDTLSCGHPLTPPSSIGTGYAVTPAGETRCYPCADSRERSLLADPATSAHLAYVNASATLVTAWTGGTLGRVTDYCLSSLRVTPTGGRYRTRTLRVTLPDGSMWRASGSDQYDAVALHRMTPAPVHYGESRVLCGFLPPESQESSLVVTTPGSVTCPACLTELHRPA